MCPGPYQSQLHRFVPNGYPSRPDSLTHMTAVLFDMDGVLVDSEDYWVEFQREEILPAAVPDAEVAVAETSGMNFREIYDYLEAEYGTAISREAFVERFEAAAEEIYAERAALLDGLHDLLAELDDRGVETALVSSSPHDWIDMVLERFDLEGSFDRVISADDVDAASKPAPDVFEYAAAELGVPTRECVVVEDSENGIEAADRAGATVVAYRVPAHGDIDRSRADAVVDSPAALRDRLLAGRHRRPGRRLSGYRPGQLRIYLRLRSKKRDQVSLRERRRRSRQRAIAVVERSPRGADRAGRRRVRRSRAVA